jgi:hypothetical protein
MAGGSLAEIAALMRELAGPAAVVTILGDPNWRPVPAAAAPSVETFHRPETGSPPDLALAAEVSANLVSLAGYADLLTHVVGYDLLPGLQTRHAELAAKLAGAQASPEPAAPWHEAVAPACAELVEEVAGRVLPLGQFAFELGPGYRVSRRERG